MVLYHAVKSSLVPLGKWKCQSVVAVANTDKNDSVECSVTINNSNLHHHSHSCCRGFFSDSEDLLTYKQYTVIFSGWGSLTYFYDILWE